MALLRGLTWMIETWMLKHFYMNSYIQFSFFCFYYFHDGKVALIEFPTLTSAPWNSWSRSSLLLSHLYLLLFFNFMFLALVLLIDWFFLLYSQTFRAVHFMRSWHITQTPSYPLTPRGLAPLAVTMGSASTSETIRFTKPCSYGRNFRVLSFMYNEKFSV